MAGISVRVGALFGLCGVLWSVAQPCQAQRLPDLSTQELLRQQEREKLLREQQQRSPEARLPRPQAPLAPTADTPDLPCRPLSALRLRLVDSGLPADSDDADGVDRFAFALDAVPGLAGWAAQPPCLGARGIDRVLQQVQNALIARGHVTTRVLAEPQDLSTGVLQLSVLPGRIRALRLDDGGSQRGRLVNALPTGPGRLLDLRDIEQGLENLKRVPSAEADFQIVPGARPGDSDLAITWRQGFPLRLGLTLVQCSMLCST